MTRPTALGPQGAAYLRPAGNTKALLFGRAVFAMGIVKDANDTEEFYRRLEINRLLYGTWNNT